MSPSSTKTKRATTLVSKRTKYQHITLVRDSRGMLLSVNRQPQVHSAEEALYHECIATVPMLLARKTDAVLILGGGDGLAARNILNFNLVKSLTLVELDQGMIDLCSTNPLWRQLNLGALTDRRLDLVIGDGIEFMIRTPKRYDIILHDLEMSFTRQPSPFSLQRFIAFFTAMYEKLTAGGIWVLTVDIDFDETLPDALFSSLAETADPALVAAYGQLSGGIAKVRFLLQSQFLSVQELTIAPPALGLHTTFYISNAKNRRYLRRPPLPLDHALGNGALPRASRPR